MADLLLSHTVVKEAKETQIVQRKHQLYACTVNVIKVTLSVVTRCKNLFFADTLVTYNADNLRGFKGR